MSYSRMDSVDVPFVYSGSGAGLTDGVCKITVPPSVCWPADAIEGSVICTQVGAASASDVQVTQLRIGKTVLATTHTDTAFSGVCQPKRYKLGAPIDLSGEQDLLSDDKATAFVGILTLNLYKN